MRGSASGLLQRFAARFHLCVEGGKFFVFVLVDEKNLYLGIVYVP